MKFKKTDSDIAPYKKLKESEKKDKFSVLIGKNGDEIVKQFSLPQVQLDVMEPNVWLVSTKLDFVTIFNDFCDAKMWVYDSCSFGPEKRIQSFVFLLQKSVSEIVLAFFCIKTKKCTGGFFERYRQEERLFVEK